MTRSLNRCSQAVQALSTVTLALARTGAVCYNWTWSTSSATTDRACALQLSAMETLTALTVATKHRRNVVSPLKSKSLFLHSYFSGIISCAQCIFIQVNCRIINTIFLLGLNEWRSKYVYEMWCKLYVINIMTSILCTQDYKGGVVHNDSLSSVYII